MDETLDPSNWNMQSPNCAAHKNTLLKLQPPPPHVDLNILEEICIINRTTCMKLINWGLVCITAQLWNSSELNLHVPLQAPHMQGITFVNN